MINVQSQPLTSGNARRPKPRKTDTTGARALLAALAMTATLGGWALIAHGTSSAPADTVADTVAVAMPVSGAPQLAPLPTVVAPLAGLDQIASNQLAPLTDNSLVLQPAPLSSAPRVTMLWPRARSRSSN